MTWISRCFGWFLGCQTFIIKISRVTLQSSCNVRHSISQATKWQGLYITGQGGDSFREKEFNIIFSNFLLILYILCLTPNTWIGQRHERSQSNYFIHSLSFPKIKYFLCRNTVQKVEKIPWLPKELWNESTMTPQTSYYCTILALPLNCC